jgi:1,4-alpha-glucan branching enzyme
MSDVAHGASQPIAMEPLRDALGTAPFFPSVLSSIRYLENHDLVNADRDDPSKILPRISKLANWDDPNTPYGRGRCRVATGILLTCPGVPMIFMGEEFAENKSWHPDPLRDEYFIWWDGLDPANAAGAARRDFNRFVRELCGLRHKLPALHDAGINAYHVNDYDRVIAFQRWVPGAGQDAFIVASFRETVYWDYQLPMPINGHFHEVFNAAAYDDMPAGGGYNTGAPGNSGGIDANGPPLDQCPYSAKCVLPPFTFLVFVR